MLKFLKKITPIEWIDILFNVLVAFYALMIILTPVLMVVAIMLCIKLLST